MTTIYTVRYVMVKRKKNGMESKPEIKMCGEISAGRNLALSRKFMCRTGPIWNSWLPFVRMRTNTWKSDFLSTFIRIVLFLLFEFCYHFSAHLAYACCLGIEQMPCKRFLLSHTSTVHFIYLSRIRARFHQSYRTYMLYLFDECAQFSQRTIKYNASMHWNLLDRIRRSLPYCLACTFGLKISLSFAYSPLNSV